MSQVSSPKQLLNKQKKFNRTILIILSLLILIMSIVASQIGALPINLWTLLTGQLQENLITIWYEIRLPRVLMAIIIGGGLSLSGAVLQGLFRNPLADPGLLGISSGAALMVSLAIMSLPNLSIHLNGLSKKNIYFIQQYILVIAAFIGGMGVATLLFFFAKKAQVSLVRLLLLGIAINAISGGVIGVFTYLSTDTQLRQFSLWTLGSLGRASFTTLFISTVMILPSALILLIYAKKLNLLQLGQEQAYYLGVDVNKTQWQILLLCAFIVGTAVAMTGIIGFVGLVIPHLLRLQFGADHRFLLPSSILGGGLFLLISDTLARVVLIPAEMPVGIITSLVGGPYFLYLILKMKS